MARLAGYLKSKHLYAFSRFNMLWICPPLIINEEELRLGLDIVEEALAATEAGLHPEADRAEAMART
jgi:taurine--2-oxoglutarate transaminase